MTWMRLTLISASPPHRMASSTFVGFAVRTASHVGNRCLRMAKRAVRVGVGGVLREDRADEGVQHGLPRHQRGLAVGGVRGAGSAEGEGPRADRVAAGRLLRLELLEEGAVELRQGVPRGPALHLRGPREVGEGAADGAPRRGSRRRAPWTRSSGSWGVPLLDCGGEPDGRGGRVGLLGLDRHPRCRWRRRCCHRLPGSVLILTEVFARLAVGVSVAAAAATPRGGAPSQRAWWLGWQAREEARGFIHSRGGMGQDGKQSGTKSTSPGVSRRI